MQWMIKWWDGDDHKEETMAAIEKEEKETTEVGFGRDKAEQFHQERSEGLYVRKSWIEYTTQGMSNNMATLTVRENR